MAKFKVMMEPNLKSHEEPLNGKIQSNNQSHTPSYPHFAQEGLQVFQI